MLLVIARHGEASFDAAQDCDRALTCEGESAVLSAFERYLDYRVRLSGDICRSGCEQSLSAVLVSPYRRAQETAQLAVKTATRFRFPCQLETCALLVPEGAARDCLRRIEACEEAGVEELWLIGHNPLLSSLLALLVDGSSGTQDSMPPLATSEIVELEAEVFGAGCATVGYKS